MHDIDSPLGKTVAYDAAYDPGLLYPLARAPGRVQLVLPEQVAMHGWDLWSAYELSWLEPSGKPRVACAEFWIPADSPNIVESKSFKLYLNSLNQHRFAGPGELQATLVRDLAQCLGAVPEVRLHLPADWAALAPCAMPGSCLDDLDVAIEHYEPAPQLLRRRSERMVEEQLFSRLLRSRCPVTGQPDWATVIVEYRGAELDRAGLLAYIVSFRQHQDFHEQCVERMFADILQRCAPERLTVYARYLRRGGLDINPWRSTVAERPVNLRCLRQ
jgi:7-cyano-7-deazaguanine reductase